MPTVAQEDAALERLTRSAEETRQLAYQLGRWAEAGQVFALSGPLGVGKTCFAQGLLAGLGVDEPVVSPTFTLMITYEGRVPVVHLDVYRLEDPSELEELGLDLARARGAVWVVEWAERAESILPEERLEVAIAYAPDQGPQARRLRLVARGAAHTALLERVLAGERCV
ncbi:MAG TPA: tRNA (adenosine(37)-N6)-threonylcarbamoyltransferase complex ATPase subunit type 1 TsaE [Bacillota bacterium]